MAHHNSTPRSVLDAPLPTVTYLVVNHGPGRRARRHTMVPTTSSATGDRNGTPKDIHIPKHRQAPAYNAPYTTPPDATPTGGTCS